MLNIISNSAKFTQKGQINVKVYWLEGVELSDKDCFEPKPYDEDGLFEKNENLFEAAYGIGSEECNSWV